MTLGSPLALALLALGLPILWIYLRRPPIPQRLVASLLLVRRLSLGDPPRRVRLRRWLSLALMLAALTLLSLGLALDNPTPAVRALVVLDDSVSMGASVDGHSRWDRATAALNRWLDAHPGATVSLLSVAPPRRLVDFTDDHRAIRQAARTLSPTRPSALSPLGLEAWCQEDLHILLLSEATPAPCGGQRVERPDLGAEADNAGITALGLTAPDALGRSTLRLSVQATSPAPQTLSLSVDHTLLERVPIDPPATLSRTLRLPARGRLVVALEGADALAADDRGTVELAPTHTVHTRIMGDDPGLFLSTALAAHPRVRLDAEPSTPVDLLILASPVPNPPTATLTVRLDAGAGAPFPSPHITEVHTDDPLMTYLDLSELRIRQARAVPVEAGDAVLVNSDQGPLVVRKADTLDFGFRLADTDLGLRVDFVNLVANLIDAASAPPSAPTAEGVLSATETLARARPARGAAPSRGLEPWPLASLLALLALLAEWRLR